MAAQRADWPEPFEQPREIFDPRLPVLPDMPPEWGEVPEEILEMIIPRRMTVIDGVETNTRGILTPDQARKLDEIAAGRWFLLRNDGPTGYRLRCANCGRKHLYFTLACIERPFNGLQQIVGLMRQYDAAKNEVGLDCVRLGTIEPITAKKALKLRQKIRDRHEEPDEVFSGEEVPTRLVVPSGPGRSVSARPTRPRTAQPRVIRLS